jgi:hypothetical protein
LAGFAMRTTYFFAVLFAALALVPAGAHLAELVHKMQLNAEDYRTVQQIYRGWALFGIVVFAALGSILVLTIRLRGHAAAFTPALVALLSIVGTQVVFWTFTYPVNRTTVNWTLLPPNWAELRAQWEYSHAVSAGLNFLALTALLVSWLRYSSSVAR